MHAITINRGKGHECEGEQETVYGMVYKEEREKCCMCIIISKIKEKRNEMQQV